MTQTQRIFNANSIKIGHINPSMMEGEQANSSMLGPGAALALTRVAPAFTTDPVITGSTLIPATLTCGPGVTTGAPQPQLTYQWKLDGVDIGGETANTTLSEIAQDTQTLTCEVTATNSEGSDVALSNGITVGIVEPIDALDLSLMTINGLSQAQQIDLMKGDTLVVTGISMEGRQDVEQDIVYMISGFGVDPRSDAQAMTAYSINGLSSEDKAQAFETDVYCAQVPEYIETLPMVNPGAETGDLTGWTIDSGTPAAVTSALLVSLPPGSTYFFSAGNTGSNTMSEMSQVIDVDAGSEADIDAGDAVAYLFAMLHNQYSTDGSEFFLDFINAADGLISSAVILPLHIHINNSAGWDSILSDPLAVPTLTRKIRITAQFKQGNNAADQSASIDNMELSLYKFT